MSAAPAAEPVLWTARRAPGPRFEEREPARAARRLRARRPRRSPSTSTSARWRTGISPPAARSKASPARSRAPRRWPRARSRPDAYCLGADQTLTVEGATSAQGARPRRRRLGRSPRSPAARHRLTSAFCVARGGEALVVDAGRGRTRHAPARRGGDRALSRSRRARACWRASASISSRGSACICSNGSAAITSPSWGCRSSSCSPGCGPKDCLRYDDRGRPSPGRRGRLAGRALALAAHPRVLAGAPRRRRAPTSGFPFRRAHSPQFAAGDRRGRPRRARTSRFRTRRRRLPPAIAGRRRPKRSAPSTCSGARTGSCGATIPTSRGFSPTWTKRRPDGRTAGSAVVIGAGGAARAIVHALAVARIRAHRPGQPHAEPGRGAGGRVRRASSSSSRGSSSRTSCPGADLLVNTSVARHGGPAGARPRSRRACRRDAVVADIVYVPLRTPLIEAARARGLRTVEGLGMLLHQAAPGVRALVRPAPRRDAGTPRAGRGGRGRAHEAGR